MAKFYELTVKFIVVGLMLISLFAFATILQADNNVSDPFIQHEVLNESFTDLQNDLGGFGEDSESTLNLFQSEDPTVSSGVLILFSVISAGKIFTSMVSVVLDSIIVLPAAILGVDPIVISTIITLTIITIVIGLWIIYKVGG